MPLPKAGSNSLFSNSFFIFITRFFPSLAGLLVVIWYSRHLPQAAYGIYQGFWIQLNVIYPIACFGIHMLVLTYSRQMLAALRQRLTSRHYALYSIWVLGLSILFALLQGSATGMPMAIPFLFIASFSISMLLEGVLIVCRSYRLLSLVSIAYAAAYCLVHWYALRAGFSLSFLFTCLMLISMARLIIYAVAAGHELNKDKKQGNTGTAIPDLKRIRNLWIHLGLYDISQVLFSWIDKFVIFILLSAPVSAVYTNGSQNIPFLPLLLSAAGSAVLMQLATGSKADEQGSIIALMNQSGRVLSCIVFPVFFFLLLFRYELIVLLFTTKYLAAIPIFAASVLTLPVKAYSFTTVLQRMHKGAIINAGAVADLVLACALMYPLYCWLGLPGVALSFVVSTYLQAAFYLVYSARLLGVGVWQLLPMANWLIKLIVFACLFIAIHYASGLYFSANITLLLGGVAMVLCIGLSLSVELNNNKKHVGNE